MSADNFTACLAIILREEGGNDDDPHDHGGRTSRGIIQREYDLYRRAHPDIPADVWQAPQKDIEAIYRLQYWQPYCDELPSGIDLTFFNASVNSGRQQAVKELQRALGVKADGMMGIETLGAVNSYPDYRTLIHLISEQRRAFYRALRQFPRYGRGWMARTDRVETAAIAMAPEINSTSAAMPFISTADVSAKANPEDTKPAPMSVQTATATTAGSGVATGIADQLQQFAGQLYPYQHTLQWVKIVLMVLAVVCAGFAIYAVIHRKKMEQVT